MTTRWIDLDGASNVRDLGGLPTPDGRVTRFGRVLRSDNLQDLSGSDVHRLIRVIGVRDVVDLRTGVEVALEGPGPLTREPAVTVHHLSLFPEAGEHTDVAADAVLPWTPASPDDPAPDPPPGGWYAGYLNDRPDSVVTALRTMATPGATLTHCAAGKDRTGVVCALALSVAGVDREAIVADYVQTGERLAAIVARLETRPTYAADLNDRSVDSHRPRPETMHVLLDHLDVEFGSPLGWLAAHGWSDADTSALRSRFLDPNG